MRATIPTRTERAQIRWLRPVAHHLTNPGLWQARPEALARRLAIGMFWAFVVPFAHIAFAAAHCVWWRANMPIAAAATLITNPVTIGGWLYLAYQVGSIFIGSTNGAPGSADLTAGGFIDTLQALGWPTALGMSIFATVGAVGGYLAMRLGSWACLHWRVARHAQAHCR